MSVYTPFVIIIAKVSSKHTKKQQKQNCNQTTESLIQTTHVLPKTKRKKLILCKYISLPLAQFSIFLEHFPTPQYNQFRSLLSTARKKNWEKMRKITTNPISFLSPLSEQHFRVHIKNSTFTVWIILLFYLLIFFRSFLSFIYVNNILARDPIFNWRRI